MKKLTLTFIATLMFAVPIALSPAQAQTFRVLHSFDGDNLSVPFGPKGSVIRDAAGHLYGTTSSGTLFKLSPRGIETTLAFINGDAGEFPSGTLARDAAGNFYGVAEGGNGGSGTIYKVSAKGKRTALFAFQGGDNTNPKSPDGGVLLASNGNIIGAALTGNNQACKLGCGSVFSLDAAGNMQFLHEFTGGADGSNPTGPLVQDTAGNLYGVAKSGGDELCAQFFFFRRKGCGVVFKIDTNNVFTVLHTFTGGKDGAVPQGGLLLDAAGNLYGTTSTGGKLKDSTLKNGTVYKISADGTYTVLHRFAFADGQTPNGGLVSDPDGNLYGTAQTGGNGQDGTIFEVSPDGTFKVLYNFQGLEDGAFPFAGLFRDEAGHLYGTTFTDGDPALVQGGNVFEITP